MFSRPRFFIQPSWVRDLTLLTLLAVPFLGAQEPPANRGKLTYFAPPKALSPDAVTADWPRFLGPTDNAKTPETHLLEKFPEGGLTKVWEMEKGTSYTSPSIVGDRLVTFNRFGDEEVIECLEPETGKAIWAQAYPVEYRDRYGFDNGPRAAPVIADGRVFTLGVTSVLTCCELATGKMLWQHKLSEEHERMSYFFGHGCAPIVEGERVIVPLGTKDGKSVFAFNTSTGEVVWTTDHPWQASYASPIVATLRGEKRLLVFAGDDSDPPVGGLLAIDPAKGVLYDAFPWRPEKYESVNGSTPVAVGGDRVFITASYGRGAAMLKMNESLKWEELWRNEDFGLHWNTALQLGDHLYGYQGRNEPDAMLAGVSVETGKTAWTFDPEWEGTLPSGRAYRLRYFRGNLLHADGRTYALGELGTLGILKLTPEKAEELDRTQLFIARSTWSLPVIHRGLLYIVQHAEDVEGNPQRLICYDLRR